MSPNVNTINSSSAPPAAAAATVCSSFDTGSCAFSTMESDNVAMNASTTCTTTRVIPSSFLRIKLDTGHEVNLPFSQSVALLATAPLLLFFCFRSRRTSRMALVLSYGLCLATATPGNLLPDGLDFRAKAKLAYALFHLPLPLMLHCFGVARLGESVLVVASLPWVCTLLLLYSTGTIPFLAFLGPFVWYMCRRLVKEWSNNKLPVQSYYYPTQHYMLPSSTTAESAPPANSNSSLVRYYSQRHHHEGRTTKARSFFRDYEEDHNREGAKTTPSWPEEQPYGPRRVLEEKHKKDSNPDHGDRGIDTGGGTGDGLGEIARISQDTGEEEIVFENVANHKANHNNHWRKVLPSLFSTNTQKPDEDGDVPELLFSPTSMGSSPTNSSVKEEEDEKEYHSQGIGRRDSLHSLLSKNASLRQLPNNDGVPPLVTTTNPSRETQDQNECNQDDGHTETLQSVFSSFPSLLQLPTKATTSGTTRNSVSPLLKTIVATPPFSGHTQSMFHPERPLLGTQGQNHELLLQLTFVFAGQDPASKVLRLTDFPHNPQSGMPTSMSCKEEAALIVPSQQSDDDATEEESVSVSSANPEHPASLSPSRGSKEASLATSQQDENTKEEGCGNPITDMPSSEFSHRCKEEAALVLSQQDDDATEEESVSLASDPLANLEHPTSLSPPRGSKEASLATSQQDEDTKEEGCGSTITDMPSSEDSHSCQEEASLASTQQDDDTTEEEFYSVASDPLANPEHPTSLSPLQGSKEASLATGQHDEVTKEEDCGKLIDDPLPHWGWTEGSLASSKQDDDSTEEEFYSVASDAVANPEHPTSLSPPHGSEEASLATSQQDEDAKEEGCGSPTTNMPTSESSHSCQEEASLASNQQDDGAMEEECVSLASDPSTNLEHATSLSPPRGSKEASLATSQQDEDTKEAGCGSLINDTLAHQGGSEASVAPNEHDAKTKEREQLLNLISELAFMTS